ncbi:hypothetical protein KYLE_16 [Pantoea phage Kyle]|uniref:Uncharacterized protein n=1 Tax=Pantoea phage Kyle TaxID=2589665 RepID=A0A514A8P3_9CAUD|nr:hypothetical protein HWC52_gp016 [Pantoea phage Kyle]QDH49637.1 hypothetical protein KYLE_16 [Pantoea phage Kyle]
MNFRKSLWIMVGVLFCAFICIPFWWGVYKLAIAALHS